MFILFKTRNDKILKQPQKKVQMSKDNDNRLFIKQCRPGYSISTSLKYCRRKKLWYWYDENRLTLTLSKMVSFKYRDNVCYNFQLMGPNFVGFTLLSLFSH